MLRLLEDETLVKGPTKRLLETSGRKPAHGEIFMQPHELLLSLLRPLKPTSALWSLRRSVGLIRP